MGKPIVGAQLYTLREYTKTMPDVTETLKKVKEIGYTSVQISGFGPVDPKEVAKVVDDLGLAVASTHMSFDRFKNELDAVIEEHKLWKCVHPAIGGLPGDYRSADGVKRFLDELAPIAEKLKAEGMDFSYHNHSHELVRYGEKTWLEMLYEQGDASVLKAEIDTYWIAAGGGDPAAWIRKCSGRIPVLHFKDMRVDEDRNQFFCEVGEGNLNWPEILKAADEAGSEWAMVEEDDCYGADPFEALATSYRNLVAMGLK